jgi:hypothetical protein
MLEYCARFRVDYFQIFAKKKTDFSKKIQRNKSPPRGASRPPILLKLGEKGWFLRKIEA